jgi:hypothetical protein
MFTITCSCGKSVQIGSDAERQEVERPANLSSQSPAPHVSSNGWVGQEVPKDYWDGKKAGNIPDKYKGLWVTKDEATKVWTFKLPDQR